MALDGAWLIELLSQNAERIQEDLTLMERGQLRIECHGADVTEQHMARYVKSLVNLETILNSLARADT